MTDRSKRGRGPVHIKEILPDVLRNIQARIVAYREMNHKQPLLKQNTPEPNPKDSVPT